MRRVLPVLVASLGLTAAMALPAGAAEMNERPRHTGGGRVEHDTRHHEGRHDDGRRHDFDRRRDFDRHHDFDRRHDRDHRFDHDRRYYYSYYYGPYYDDPYYDSGACPDGGYYDGDGQYWYWDPATGGYVPCY